MYALCVFVRFYTHENLHAYNYKQKMYAKKIYDKNVSKKCDCTDTVYFQSERKNNINALVHTQNQDENVFRVFQA